MKVLDEGKWKKPWSVEVMCSEEECGAKLLVEEGDLKPMYDSWPAKYFVVCPVCESESKVAAESVPLWVKKDADKKKKWASSDWR